MPENFNIEKDTSVANPLQIGDTPPKELQPWLAPIPINSSDLNKDWSYNTLYYLSKLGYTDATWNLAESHTTQDVCDNLSGATYNITDLINNAQHTPPSPIFTLSHPKCYCFLRCEPPFASDLIPDDAPGLPLYALKEEIEEYKIQMFNNFAPIFVDYLTLPPDDAHYSFENVKKRKFGKQYKSIKPVIITQDFKCLLPLGFYRPLFKDLVGLQVEESDFLVKVFLKDLYREFEFPKAFISNYESEDFKPQTDGNYKLLLRSLENSTSYYYDSSSNKIIIS